MPTKRNAELRHDGMEILIVEDSPTQSAQLQYLLEQNRFKVAVAANGLQALAALEKSVPQLVVTDVVMPGMDGYELCRRIKSGFENLPVILVTSLADVKDVLKGLECGADNFIRKPYDEKYLLSRIDYLLMNREIRKSEKIQMGINIHLSGQSYYVTAERQQILDLLISTYEEAVRMKEELEMRQQEIACANRYEQTLSAVLRLFSSSFDRPRILQDMLAILADHHPFPVSAVYGYDEWGGRYRLEASHAAPPGLRSEFLPGADGVLEDAATREQAILLPGFDARFFQPMDAEPQPLPYVSVCLSPVNHQDKRMALLLLASTQPVEERDLAFIEHLSAQLGVALHNLQQYGDLKLLAEQLRLRSEEIASKNAQLEAASRMKSEFLANMSHELRTPLNAIIGFSEVMRDGLTGEMTDRQREYVSDIFESGQHLLSLINDVLDLSKIEAGRMVLEDEPTDIGALLAGSLSIIKEKAAIHHVKLQLDMPDDLGECRMDPRKVKQIVYNLLSNAVKFTPEGGAVTLRARLASREEAARRASDMPEVRSPSPDGVEKFLEIAVGDTGIGIAAEDMARLFQPFVQLDSSLSRRFEGTGLGLVMVRKLTELHGGAIAVASRPGSGSTFTVWLPYCTAATVPVAVESAASQALSPPAGRTPLVLVVEDDDQAADLIRLQLEADGCSIMRAPTAEAALAMLEKDPLPDLVSLDILLPGMDGWEFLARLKNVPRLASLPVVILSIVADNNLSRGLSLGASAVLQKPVSAEDLAAALANLGLVLPANAGKPATVLVVDDDPKAVEIVAAFLEHADYAVLRAYGGAEGIQMANSCLPDLIVLDLMMPEVSGFEVAETLKQQRKTASIPILVLTAKLLTAEDRKLLNGHVMQVLEKSEFNHGGFIGEVRRALGRKWQKPAVPEGGASPWQES